MTTSGGNSGRPAGTGRCRLCEQALGTVSTRVRSEFKMPLLTGCDLVSIKRFEDRLREGGSGVLERIFLPSEYARKSTTSLAGMFAAKEALCKALRWPPGHWLDIVVEHELSGAPRVVLLHERMEILDMSVSITHEGDYALAFAVVMVP